MNTKPGQVKKALVLIVDDALPNLHLLSTLLTEDGYEVQGVASGEAALKVVETVLPDLILLDIDMPHMDGFEVCTRLKANKMTQDIPIIFISALEKVLDKVRAFQLGGVDYITKPFQIEEVLARVENHLTRRNLEKELKRTNTVLEERVAERTVELSKTIDILEEQIAERKQAEAALQQHAERLRILHKIDQAILAVQSPEAIIQAALGHIRQLIPCQQASLALFNFETGEAIVHLIDATAVTDNTHLGVGEHIPLALFGDIENLQRGQPHIVEDILTLDELSPADKQLLAEEMRSLINVPLNVRNELIGSLNLGAAVPKLFTAEDLAIMRELATQLAVALDNARLHKDLRDRMQTLKDTQAQLIHSEKMAALGRLVASIAHEINNPLQAVQTCLTLTSEELAGDQRREKLDRYLGIVENEIERVSSIVQRMRDFYRPTRHGFQPVDLHAILESVLTLTDKQLHYSNIIVERTWSTTLPKIQANADHLRQVFLNMVLNAIDAMPQGGTLTISTLLAQEPLRGNQPAVPSVQLTFCDTGAGMSSETQANIFEPFFTTKEKGSGLGLAISYGIIEAHHGQITATSQSDLGTTFTILLPLEQP